MGESPWYQHDKAPCHKSRLTQLNLHHRRIPTIEWPPYSPDLNLIEHVSGLDEEAHSRQLSEEIVSKSDDQSPWSSRAHPRSLGFDSRWGHNCVVWLLEGSLRCYYSREWGPDPILINQSLMFLFMLLFNFLLPSTPQIYYLFSLIDDNATRTLKIKTSLHWTTVWLANKSEFSIRQNRYLTRGCGYLDKR